MAETQDREITIRGLKFDGRGPVDGGKPVGTWIGCNDQGSFRGSLDPEGRYIQDWFFWDAEGVLVWRESYGPEVIHFLPPVELTPPARKR